MLAERRIDKPHTSNGHSAPKAMQGNLHLPERLPIRVRVVERLKKFGMVAKQDGRYTISQPLALVIIGVLLTGFYAYYSRSSEKLDTQREEIIVLRTKLELEQAKNADQDSKIDQARATAQIADRNAARLEGKFDQFALQYATGKKKPMSELGDQ
jgi:hypothetical protein